jgi:fructokinase
MAASEILCVGELLWDALPAGLFLGGSPFNVACHLRAAGQPVAMVSRVGRDRLGEEALRRVARYGVGTDLVQVDPVLPTGFVGVTLDDAGRPDFEIVSPAAWDAIEPSDALVRRAAAARAIVFGSLAQRSAASRHTIQRLWDSPALMVFAVNLRAPHDDREVVRQSLHRADVVKVTEEELRQLAAWFHLPGAPRTVETVAALARTFDCRTVCVTRGCDGAAMWRGGAWTEHAGFDVEVVDTVGAGDAFLAAVLSGLLARSDDYALLERANLLGAYVASQAGAVPAHDAEAMARIAGVTR